MHHALLVGYHHGTAWLFACKVHQTTLLVLACVQDVCPKAKVHVFDMRREMRLPLHNHTATVEVLEGAFATSLCLLQKSSFSLSSGLTGCGTMQRRLWMTQTGMPGRSRSGAWVSMLAGSCGRWPPGSISGAAQPAALRDARSACAACARLGQVRTMDMPGGAGMSCRLVGACCACLIAAHAVLQVQVGTAARWQAGLRRGIRG